MTIGPRDKPSPLILHINSTNNAPAKIAEASAIYVTTLSAVNISATNYLGLTGAGTPAGPDVGLVQYYANSTNFGSDPTFKFTPETKILSVSNVSSTNSESVVANVGVLTANTILNPVILVSTQVSAAYGNISELSSVIVSATTYKNLPTSSLSGLADVQFTNPLNGQSLVWSSTRWVASSVDSGITDHGNLAGLQDNDHPQYVLSSTNANLSSLVSNIQTSAGQLSSTLANHLASAVHWDLTTLNSNYLNSSGDTANAGFYLQSVSAATVSATDYLNLPSSTIRWLNAYNTEVVRKYVKNSTGASIPKGTPVTITGATGDNSLITPLSSVNTHIPEAIGLSNHVFGLTESQILNDNFGYIITEGMLSGTGGQGSINTSQFNPGDILYVSSNGLLSNVRPAPPYESHPVGYVVRSHAIVGSIYVKIETVPEINDIVGFNLTSSLINGDLITYDLTTSTFVNKQSVTVSGQVRSGSVSATTYLNLPQANASSLNGFNIDLPITPEQYSILAYQGASWQSTNTPRFISVSATSYLNLPTSSLSGLADVRVTSTPSNGQSLVWSSTKWIASSIAGGPGATDHGALTGLEDNDHPQYVLSSTNATLSSLVSNIQTSTVNLSSTVGNLQTSTLNLSSLLGTHISSAVHWDLTTLNSNYINSSGDSSNNSFYFGTLSATTFSATNYKNLPTSSLSGMLDVSVVSPSGGQALIYSSSVNKWYPGYTIYQRNTAPDSSIGVNGDIYFQYTNTNEIIALSGLTDTEITPPITNGQSLVWNSGLNKWAPSALPLPVGSNYNFQFYKDSNLSSTSSFVWNPSDFGGSLSAAVPFSSSRWAYFSETVGVGQGIILYGNGGGQTAYIKNGPAGTTAVSANSFITPSLSATTISATAYLNLLSGAAIWNASALQGTRLNLTPTALGILAFNLGADEINAYTPAAAAIVLNPEFSLSSLKDTASWTNPAAGDVLKWNGSKWNPGAMTAGAAGSNYQLQFNNGGSLSAVADMTYAPNLFGGPQLVLSGSTRLYVTNSIYTPYINVGVQTNVGPDSAAITSQASSTIKVLSSILVPSAIFFGSGIPSTATQQAGIYYTGQSAQNVPPAIYQCNQDNLNIYTAFGSGKAIRLVDQIQAAGGIAGSGYEFDGNSFIIQHGANTSATLVVPSNGVLQVVSSVSAVTVSANNLWNTIFKTSDQTITNTTTNVPDNELRFNMDANKSYTYRANLFFSSTANGDFKVSPSSTNTIFRNVMLRRTVNPGATAYGNMAVSSTGILTNVSSTVLQTITGPPGIVNLDGTITNGSSANTFYIMWSQNTADGVGSTTVMLGSYIDWKLLN